MVIQVPTSKTKLVCHIDPWSGGEDITNSPSERVTMVGGNNKQSPPDDRDKSHHRPLQTPHHDFISELDCGRKTYSR